MDERFGRYELLRKIATGGMAEIYLARTAGSEGELRVIKRILPHLAVSEEFVQMFLHEARVAVRLDHPNIVRILELGEADGAYFIAMEYVHGDDARRVWRQSVAMHSPIPVPLVCRIVADAAAGLDYAHQRRDTNGKPLDIIHRDVSPQNILLSFDGAVKVADFGIARAANQVSHTRTGVIKGKHSYMSPEHASGRAIDQRTDQFALGVVLFELLTQRRLFKRASDLKTIAAVAECKVPRPSELVARVPKELDRIVLTALAPRPEDRYRDLGALRQALEAWVLGLRQPSSAADLRRYLHALYAQRLESERRASGCAVHETSSAEDGRLRSGASSPSASSACAAQNPAPPSAQAAEETRAPGGWRATPSPALGASSEPEHPRRTRLRRAAVGAVGAMLALGVAVVLPKRGPGQEGRQTPPPSLATGAGVETSPPGARVSVGAPELAALTPMTAQGLGLGEPQVRLALDGDLVGGRTVRLEQGGEVAPLATSRVRSAPERVALPSEPAPPGAEVRGDGRAVGLTPASVEVGANREAEVSKRPAAPAPSAPVEIASEPGGNLFDEGEQQSLGPTPFRGRLSLGRHALVVANRELGLEHRFWLEVRPKGPNVRRLRFARGEVQIAVKPLTMGADIYLRGRKIGTAPLKRLSLLVGDYELTAINEALKRTRRVDVSVRAGKVSLATVDLMEERSER